MKLDLSFLLVLMVPAVAMADMDQFDSNIDLDHAGRGLKIDWTVDTYEESLGQCRGATCGLWGDPHIVTCDGLAYDCQGHGLFTIMKNHMYNIQGRFVDTGTAARRLFEARKSKWRPTITNDVMIDYLESPDPDNKYPILQFSFGNIAEYDGQIISEQGCTPNHHFEPMGMKAMRGTVPIRAGSVAHCRSLCARQEGCTGFSFWANHICRLNEAGAEEVANPEGWSRSVLGTLDSDCGKVWDIPQLLSDEEEAFRGEIAKQCPLLFHIDGVLQDISAFNPSNPGSKKSGYILGDEDSDISVYKHLTTIKIKYTTKNDDIAEVHFKAGGHGPGELWSCYWNVYVCLPESEEDIFRDGGLGLLGTPNGNNKDDWINTIGEPVDIDFSALRGIKAKDYCVDNWCVSQIDSIMMPTGDQTYDNVKCEHEDYIDFDIHDPGCVLSADEIIKSCVNVEPLLRFACEVDCCFGGCDDLEDVRNDLNDMKKKLSDDPDDTQYGVPDHKDCNDSEFLDTGETVCPEGSGNAVKLLHSSGSMPLPEDADIIYGIEMNTEPHDEITGMSVRFKVNNFLTDRAHVYVKHDKSVYDGFLDPVCETMESKVGGCDDDPQIIEAGCYNYNGITPFALVTVYIQSGEIIDDSATEVAMCCDEKPLLNSGVVKYTFEINCECPPAAIE